MNVKCFILNKLKSGQGIVVHTSVSNFMKICLVKAESFHVETNNTWQNSHFLQFLTNVPKDIYIQTGSGPLVPFHKHLQYASENLHQSETSANVHRTLHWHAQNQNIPYLHTCHYHLPEMKSASNGILSYNKSSKYSTQILSNLLYSWPRLVDIAATTEKHTYGNGKKYQLVWLSYYPWSCNFIILCLTGFFYIKIKNILADDNRKIHYANIFLKQVYNQYNLF